MKQSFEQALSFFDEKVLDLIRQRKNIGVITHIDCDGISSGSIVTKALVRAGAKCTVTTTKEITKNVIENMKNDSRDFHIITDLGGGFAKLLDENLDDRWCVLDHHEIPQDEYDNERVINAWKYGIDGGTEICAGGMAYQAAKVLNEKNSDLAAAAVVSALGDRQDVGEKNHLPD